MTTFQATLHKEMARLEDIVSHNQPTYGIPFHRYEKKGSIGRKPSRYVTSFLSFVRVVSFLF
mgnify:FL=1